MVRFKAVSSYMRIDGSSWLVIGLFIHFQIETEHGGMSVAPVAKNKSAPGGYRYEYGRPHHALGIKTSFAYLRYGFCGSAVEEDVLIQLGAIARQATGRISCPTSACSTIGLPTAS